MKERPILFSGSMVRAILREVDPKGQTRRIMNPQPSFNQVHEWKGKTLYDGESRMWCWKDLILGNIWDFPNHDDRRTLAARCPHGQPGDQIWVREAFYITAVQSGQYGAGFKADHPNGNLATGDGGYNFRSFSDDPDLAGEQWNWANRHKGTDRWIPSIHMPRWASRITLEITGARVERLQEITESDAKAEGCEESWSSPHWQGYQRINGQRMGCSTGCGQDRSAPAPEWMECAELVPSQMLSTARQRFTGLWHSINGKTHPWAENPWVWVIEFKRIEVPMPSPLRRLTAFVEGALCIVTVEGDPVKCPNCNRKAKGEHKCPKPPEIIRPIDGRYKATDEQIFKACRANGHQLDYLNLSRRPVGDTRETRHCLCGERINVATPKKARAKRSRPLPQPSREGEKK